MKKAIKTIAVLALTCVMVAALAVVFTACGEPAPEEEPINLDHDTLKIKQLDSDYVIWGVKDNTITELDIPDFVTRIDSHVFDNTAWYENQPYKVPIYAGKFVYAVKSLHLEDTVVTLKDDTVGITSYAFQYSGLTEIVLPESLVNIGVEAFKSCGALESIIIPKGVKKIDTDAFLNCKKLATVTIDSYNVAKFSSSDSKLLEYAETVYVKEGLEVSNYIATAFPNSPSSDKDGYVKYVR